MPSDAEFLAAIRQHPEDVTLRPSYGRWLRAQGDARAELIEIEERARVLAVDSDAYWKLKPSRNAARKACDSAWLEALGYLTCRPVLANPGDTHSRFRLIRELLEQWHGVELGDVGRVSDECVELEQRAGAPLSLAVREWLALASDLSRTGVIGPEGALGHVRKRFKPELAGIALSQVVHETGGLVRVVRSEDLGLDDPPVRCWVEDELEGESWWDDDLPLPHLTVFTLEYLLGRLPGSVVAFDISSDVLSNLEAPGLVTAVWGDVRIEEGLGFIVWSNEGRLTALLQRPEHATRLPPPLLAEAREWYADYLDLNT